MLTPGNRNGRMLQFLWSIGIGVSPRWSVCCGSPPIARRCVHVRATRFYYDFFNEEKKMTDSDLKLIKKEMDKIIRQKLPLVREEVTR